MNSPHSQNPDAVVLSVPPVSDPADSVYAQHANGVGRSAIEDWRIALHEAGHVVLHRLFGTAVSVTIVPDAECSGKTWWPQGVDAAAIWNADSITEPGVSRNGDVRGVFAVVQQSAIAMMGGCAAEVVFLTGPPRFIGSDVPNASRIAGLVCRTTASIEAFVEHTFQEALALVEQHKPVVHAIAQALIDHPKRTLDGAEIDAVIALVLAVQAAADESKRRADWRGVEHNAANFSARLES